ncbi:probetacellulin [Rhinophrynus dorsalis]
MDALTLSEHLLLALVLGLTVLPCTSSDGNSTAEPETRSPPCPQFDEDCTELSEPAKWRGHFSRCPKTYRHYCIKGRCRFVKSANTPACICELGYTGARCEYLDLFYLKGDRGQIVVIGLIVAMVTLIILIILICICSHHCRKAHRRKKKAKAMERLNKDSTAKMEETDAV